MKHRTRPHRPRPATFWLTAFFGVCLILGVSLGLEGCGKRGSLAPPPDEENTYPRSYPPE